MSTATGGRIMTNHSEVLAAPPLATRYETLVRVSRAIGAHRDPKELFGMLVDELHGVVQFDFIGLSLRDQNSDTFQGYFIDMASSLGPEGNNRCQSLP